MQYNVNNPSIKRILREVKEMDAEPSSQYTATPLEDNLFEWHFTIKGPAGTEFDGGLYHGRIILPPEYPFKPPNIVLLNPSGRFEVGTKICLSISSYHPEHWQPSWSIRTVLVALISFMPTKGEGAIGALDDPPEVRRKLAAKTIDYSCDKCGAKMCDVFPQEETLAHEASESDNSHTQGASQNIFNELNSNSNLSNNSPNIDTNNNNLNLGGNNTNNNNLNNNNNIQNSSHNSNTTTQYTRTLQNLDNDIPPASAYIPSTQPQIIHPQATHFPDAHVGAMMHAPAPVHAHAPVQVDPVSAHASDSQVLDYMIMAIVIAILALLARKMYTYAGL